MTPVAILLNTVGILGFPNDVELLSEKMSQLKIKLIFSDMLICDGARITTIKSDGAGITTVEFSGM